MRIRMPGGVGGALPGAAPYPDDGKTLSTGHLIGLLMDGPAVILGMRGMATDAIQAGELGQPGRLTARSTLTLTLPLPFFS